MTKTCLLLVVTLCIFTSSFSQSILFVRAGAAGKGTSWQDALGDLSKALSIARKGTQIWVAQGTYYPVHCNPCSREQRAIAFEIPDGVALFGGFKGNENSLHQRRWEEHPSTLSGNIGSADAVDNSFNVIVTRSAREFIVVDGFIIAEANAIGQRLKDRHGGGWYNGGVGEGQVSSPVIRNCIFLNNQAEKGGAFFNDAAGGYALPSFENCSFVGNKAGYAGGAIYNHGADGDGSIIIRDCKFVNNEALFGGAIFHSRTTGTSDPVTKECQFVNNGARWGGAIFTLGFDKNLLPEFQFCRFLNNRAMQELDVLHCNGQKIPEHWISSLTNGETVGL